MEKHEPRTPEQILQEAFAREVEARDFYAHLATQCHVDFVRELLERLTREETKHLHLIQEMMTKMNLGKEIV